MAVTSKFIRYFQSNGQPISTAVRIWIVPQANEYPAGAVELTSNVSKPGYYYHDATPDGEYKIYIDVEGGTSPALFEEHVYHGEKRLSTIIDFILSVFNINTSKLATTCIDITELVAAMPLATTEAPGLMDWTDKTNLASCTTLAHTHSNKDVLDTLSETLKIITNVNTTIPDYLGQPGKDANGHIYIAIALTGTMWTIVKDDGAVPTDGESIGYNQAYELEVKDTGVNMYKLNADVAGDGLSKPSTGSPLKVAVDNITLAISSGLVAIKSTIMDKINAAYNAIHSHSNKTFLDTLTAFDGGTTGLNQAGEIEVKDGGIDKYKINSDVAGAGLVKTSAGNPISVSVDGTTIEIVNNALQVKLSGLSSKADLVDGKVPSTQLPSYVDDVIEAADTSQFPTTGESGKIYVALDTNKTYRWSGTAYTEISASIALGETSATAYRGDRGKIAYDHSQATGNPHGVTKSDVGLGNVENTAISTWTGSTYITTVGNVTATGLVVATNLIYADTTNKRVGINNSTPAYTLEIGSGSTGTIAVHGNSYLGGVTNVGGALSSTGGTFNIRKYNDAITVKFQSDGDNYINSGSLVIGGTTVNASALLELISTTKGLLLPRMTTTQRTAITSPAEGLVVYDTTLHKLCQYNGGAWEVMTSA